MSTQDPIPVDARQLLDELPAFLTRVTRGEVFEVRCDGSSFVLGADFPGLFASFGPEYGWPDRVDVETVTAIGTLMPGHRRHPVLWHNGRPVAMSIAPSEYEAARRLGQHP